MRSAMHLESQPDALGAAASATSLPSAAPPRATWNRQRPSPMPSHRYADAFARVAIPHPAPGTQRAWPDAKLTSAPLWVPVDLRDGNQALAEPMDPERKRRFFSLMVDMGYREIEVGYPSASQTDYDFVRLIAETDLAPSDVTIVVFTPARRDLIERTVASIAGITNEVVIHMYTATAPVWRETVLGKDRDALRELILTGGRDVLELAGHLPNVRFQFSPEVFTLTEPDFAVEICDAMTELWDARPERPVTLNLPATVEIATPNVYADQIEYMHRTLARRDGVILSVHPHNDRGTGVACAELAVLAGAQRVEGCIFGNGERTGNVDIATLALNLHAQGVDPMIDFSDIDEIRRTVEYCTRLEVPARHPYVGDLVHTAFSGTHQDAIKKGFAEHRARAATTGVPAAELAWRVPYLPIDPADIGRNYDAVIRVNSQSGKGGIAYLLETAYGIELPRRFQMELARRVQQHTDVSGGEASAEQLWDLLHREFVSTAEQHAPCISLVSCDTHDVGASDDVSRSREPEGIAPRSRVEITLRGPDTPLGPGIETRSTHLGVGPVEALTEALAGVGIRVDVLSLHQTSMGAGSDSGALTLIEYRGPDGTMQWAGGCDTSAFRASTAAVMRAALVA